MNRDNPLFRNRFPRSNHYDPNWVMDNQMGPNVLWLTEWLTEMMEIKPDERVLDLGCGKAISSIFLAKEFDARVWAVDLWVSAQDNLKRIEKAGLSNSICPVHAEAHSLPFAEQYFHTMVSLDAYTYFGTDDLYLSYITRFLMPGGRLGVVMPAVKKELEGEVPEHLTRPQKNGDVFWSEDCICFHTAEWWKSHWEKSGRVKNVDAEYMPEGWELWRDFEDEIEKAGKNLFPSVAETLDRDRGEYIGFVGLTAERAEISDFNLYDPALMGKVERA